MVIPIKKIQKLLCLKKKKFFYILTNIMKYNKSLK